VGFIGKSVGFWSWKIASADFADFKPIPAGYGVARGRVLCWAAAKLLYLGSKVIFVLIPRCFAQGLTVSANLCLNPAKLPITQSRYAAFRGGFTWVSRHGNKLIKPPVNKGDYLFYAVILSVSRQDMAFSEPVGFEFSLN